MLDNKIFVFSKNKNQLNKDFEHLYINEDINECLICFREIDKIIVLFNNYCKCYKYSLICEECALKWIKSNNICFICRKTFEDENKTFNEIYYIQDSYLKNKIINTFSPIINNNYNIPHDQEISNFYRNSYSNRNDITQETRVINFYRDYTRNRTIVPIYNNQREIRINYKKCISKYICNENFIVLFFIGFSCMLIIIFTNFFNS